jgi:hypothetical protein
LSTGIESALLEGTSRPPLIPTHAGPYDQFIVDFIGVNPTDNLASMSVDFFAPKNSPLVQAIYISIAKSAIFTRFPDFARSLRQFFLDEILRMYGKPSKVMIEMHAVVAEANAPHVYDIWVFYDTAGILVHYQGIHSVLPGEVQVCPRFDTVQQIDLYLQAPARKFILERFPNEVFGYDFNAGYVRSLEETTSLSLENFYETFSKFDNQNCFTSPSTLWQSP